MFRGLEALGGAATTKMEYFLRRFRMAELGTKNGSSRNPISLDLRN